MTKEKDDIILSKIASKNQQNEGFRLLIAEYKEPLYWQVRKIVQFHTDADDVLQNVFEIVCKKVGQFKGKSSLYTWLYRIATNESIRHLQKKKRYTYSEDDPIVEEGQYQFEELWEGDRIRTLLQKLINELPTKQRIVFEMRYFDEAPYKEMAEILETSEGALKASFHHAVKKIESGIKKMNLYA